MSDHYEVRVRPQTVFSVHQHHPYASDLNREIASNLSIGSAGEIAQAIAKGLEATGRPVEIYGCDRTSEVLRAELVTGDYLAEMLRKLADAPLGSTLVFGPVNDKGHRFLQVTQNTLRKGVL